MLRSVPVVSGRGAPGPGGRRFSPDDRRAESVASGRRAQLRGGRPAVEPEVLAADASFAELPDVEHPERHAPAVARDAEELALDRPGPIRARSRRSRGPW